MRMIPSWAAIGILGGHLITGWSQSYELDWDVVAGGGGTCADTTYELRDTLGQPAVGIATINDFLLEDGFWPGMNSAPQVVPDTLERATNLTAKIKLDTLLANDSDPDGDGFDLTALDATSAAGGAIVLDNGWVCYGPPEGFNRADTFNYVVTDAEGNQATNTVTVVMQRPGDEPTRNIIAITTLPNGHKLIRFIGLAGRTHAIEWTTDLGVPNWQALTTQVAGANGYFEYEDPTEPPPAQRFYRAVCY